MPAETIITVCHLTFVRLTGLGSAKVICELKFFIHCRFCVWFLGIMEVKQRRLSAGLLLVEILTRYKCFYNSVCGYLIVKINKMLKFLTMCYK